MAFAVLKEISAGSAFALVLYAFDMWNGMADSEDSDVNEAMGAISLVLRGGPFVSSGELSNSAREMGRGAIAGITDKERRNAVSLLRQVAAYYEKGTERAVGQVVREACRAKASVLLECAERIKRGERAATGE